jgi:gliding motility-associated-like protein
MKKIILLITIAIFGTASSFAQIIDAEPEVTLLCTGGSATLTATVTAPGTGGAPGSLPTTSYAISSIPFSPAPLTGGTSTSATDDSQVGPFPIGFSFCFFGVNYTNFYIGSNGWVAFTAQPTTYTSATIPSALGTVPKNCIMGPWQDWNPGIAGGPYINYQTSGTAPNRKLVVNYNNIPMYSCTSQLGRFQIVIYESSNVIENYIISKPNCPTWAGGTAVQGLHNAAGTVAFVVPGRNSTQWTASNEGWRYTPNGSATYTINWYILPADSLIGTGSPITVTPVTSPQYYYAEVTGPSGCGTGVPNTDTVVVNSTSLVVDAGPYSNICSGIGTMLNASGGVSYSWSPVTGLSDPTVANPVANPSVTTVYTVMVTDAFGCVGFDTVTVGVQTSPLADAGFPAGICSGDNIMLGGNGSGGTYSWSPGATLDDSTILTPVAAPTITTTYTLTITNSLGCSTSDTVSVIILNPAADAGPDVAICPGFSTNLSASGGDVFDWTPGTGLSDSTIANPVATPLVTTTYTVLVSNSSTGCSATDSVIVTITPAVIANAGADTSICIGNNTTLGASGGIGYAWTPTTSINDSTIFNPVASPTTTTTYTVIVTDASGCVSSDSVTITVNPLPAVSAGSDFSICIGASASLNASGASNYTWSPGATLNDSTIAGPVASPSSPTTYIVTGIDTNGCVSADTVLISLNGLTITTSATATVCMGDSTTLSVSGGLTYIWSPSATLNNDTISNPVATPIGTTTYTVIGTAGTGCSDTAYVTVNVNSLPPVNAGTSLSICNGSNANLSVTGANTYVWSPAGSLNNPNIPAPIASPSTTTLYTVTGTDLNGCFAQDTITVVVHPIPSANAGSNTSICLGDSTTLNGSGGGTYNWTPAAGLSSTSIANPVATPTVTTTYTVTVMGSGFCTASAQVTVTVNAIPTATASADASICNGGSTMLTVSGGTSYFWTPSAGLSSSTSASPTASPGTTTTYVVTASNAAGCTDQDTVVVTVSNALSIASSSVTDETCFDNDGSLTVGAITGGAGPYMYSLDGGASQSSNTFSSLSQGTYLVTVTDIAGCAATQNVSVGQIVNVDASFTANPPSGPKPLSVTFDNTSTGATSYFWNFGNTFTSVSTDPSTVYPDNGTYTVTLYASNGGAPCIDSATVTITVFEEMAIAVPNVFTPNGDSKNDMFEIQSTGVSELNGTIFNRWGKKIYEWNGDANSGWNGTVNGNTAQDGTYYYILKIKATDGKETEQKGYVQLLSQ